MEFPIKLKILRPTQFHKSNRGDNERMRIKLPIFRRPLAQLMQVPPPIDKIKVTQKIIQYPSNLLKSSKRGYPVTWNSYRLIKV